MQELNQRLRTLEDRVNQPDPLSIIKALGQVAGSIGTTDDYTAQLSSLQEEVETFREENKKLQEDLRKLREAYDDALGIYDMFTNMASISQIMSLGDFKQQMKTTLDKWGNVLDITFARSV